MAARTGGRCLSSAGGKHPGSGKPRELRCGASLTLGAAVTVTGRGATARDPGQDSKQTPRLLLRSGHLTFGQHRLASAGVDYTCASSLRVSAPRPSPHNSPFLDCQARAAHLDQRRLRELGARGAAP